MKLPRALAAAPLLVLLALFATACVSTENPQGWAAPVFDGDTVYFLPSKDHVSAVPLAADAQSSTLTWTFPDKNKAEDKNVKLQAIYGEPVVDGDNLYFTSFSGGVWALNKTTGRPIWDMKSEITGNVTGGIAISGNFAVFGTTEGRLYVVNKADKSTAPGWPTAGKQLGDGIWATPVVKGDTIYVATMGGDVHALKLTDGSESWAKPFHASGAIADLSLLNDTTLFAPGLNKHVYLLNTADGTIQHEFVANDWVWTQPAYDAERHLAYFGDFAGELYALDITTGQATWHESLGSARVKSAPAIVDNVLVVGDRKPTVHFLDLNDNGKQLNEVPLTGDGTLRADIAAKNGFAYIATTNGKLLRADPKQKNVIEITLSGRQ